MFYVVLLVFSVALLDLIQIKPISRIDSDDERQRASNDSRRAKGDIVHDSFLRATPQITHPTRYEIVCTGFVFD